MTLPSDRAGPSPPVVGIVGAGALGSYVGAHLVRAGFPVRFLLRSDFEAARQEGIWVRQPEGEWRVPVQAFRSAPEMGVCDLLVIAIKTTAREQLAELLPPLTGPQTCWVTLQNGMGNVEYLSRLHDPARIGAGVCLIGVVREGPGRLYAFTRGGGTIQLAAARGSPPAWLRGLGSMLDRSGLKAPVMDDLRSAIWHKLLWNIPFNGLTVAGGGVPTSTVLELPHLRRFAYDLMKEIQSIARADGVEIPDALVDRQFSFTEPLGAYRPSSLEDFERGRPLEIEAIFQAPLHRGEELGVPAPALRALCAILDSLNRKYCRAPA